MNKINWHYLDKLFVDKLVSMFEWPFNRDYYKSGSLFTNDDAYDCISNNLGDHVGWRWDGDKITLYAVGCSKDGEIYFSGPIYKESINKIGEIEKALTKLYVKWGTPYFEQLKQKTIEGIQNLQEKEIPVNKIILPQDWYKLLGKVKHLFGILVQEGSHFCIISSKEYGNYGIYKEI